MVEGHLEQSASGVCERQEKLLTDVANKGKQAYCDNHAVLHCVDVGDVAGRGQI